MELEREKLENEILDLKKMHSKAHYSEVGVPPEQNKAPDVDANNEIGNLRKRVEELEGSSSRLRQSLRK